MTTYLLGALLLLTNGQSVNFFSAEQDAEIGAESVKAADLALPLILDANLNRYFRSIGQRVTRHALRPSLRYRFHLINSKEINSLGFPGGAIYVHRGLLEMASSEDELAAILAHEAGHVMARHGTAQLSRQLLMQSPLSIAVGLPTMEGLKEQLMRLGISLGIDAPFLRYNRDQELEANLTAVRLLAGSRFDPAALQAVLDKIQEVQSWESARPPAFIFSHPQPQALAPEMAELLDRFPSPKRARTAEFDSFRSALLKVAYPIMEPAGDPGDDELPNVFVHEKNYFRLRYPSGWQITRAGADGAIVTPAGSSQTLRIGSSDITHGVMFDLFDLSAANRPLTLEEATNRLIVFLRQRNQSLRIVPGAQSLIPVSDEPGLRTVMIGESTAQSLSEVVWVVTRVYYQSLFYLVFVAPEDEFPMYQPIFEQIIRSARIR